MNMDLEAVLRKDVGRGDVTTMLVVPDTDGSATIVCERDAVVAGIKEATELLESVGVSVATFAKDGEKVKGGSRVLSISGPLRTLLTTERTVLNLLSKMSGIATITAEAVEKANGKIIVAATRKTTPGFGDMEKKAVEIAGGDAHRLGLDSMIMVKDNHIKACGSVRAAMEKLEKAPFYLKKEVEVSNIEDAETAARMGADIIMADNCGPELTGIIRIAVKSINDRILVEASGNITVDNLTDYIGKADIVSMGQLTHSAPTVMFNMDLN